MAHHHEEKSSLHNKNNNKIMVSSSTSSTFCYPEISPNNNNPNTQFHNNNNNNFDHQNTEIYHLANGLEMIGFQPKQLNNNNNNNHHASKSSNFMQQQHHHHNLHQIGNNFLDETTLRTSSCVFPCEGNERPSQGLSLSLSSSNPSSIGVQSFELRNNNHHFNNNPRFNHSQSSFQQQEFFLGKSASNSSSNNNNNSTTTSGLSMSLSSKYMGPTQELLNEFCNLGTQQKQSMKNNKKKKNKDHHHHDNNWELLSHDHHNITNDNDLENNASSSSSSRNNDLITTSLYGLSILDLQKRKTKLFGMLEELDRRYKHYCDQMKGIESSFESAAGVGTAIVYTNLASKAMSKHFRCLRDSLVAQIKATKKAMGEKDASNSNSTIPGTSKGETPRLRILDQTLRQQRAFQQMSMMEAHPWRPQRGLPERSVSVLRAWLFEHFLHPYPSDVDKHILARQTGLSRSQVSNWFINARVRLWKPMVEQMYQEESKEQQDKNMGSSSDATDHQPNSDHDGLIQDQKPNPEELVRLDHHESLSSIVNTTNPITNSIILNTNNNLQQSQPFGRAEPFGYVALADFPSSSSYNDDNNAAPQQGFGGSTISRGNNVSLTLGLQQHGGNGVSLAFSPASQGTLFYGRDHIDDCQPSVHDYSLLDGDQGQNLPYRNLMDAQLLHDFAQ